MTTYLPESLEVADELLLLEADGNLSQMPIGEVDDNSRAIVEALLREANHDVDKEDAPLPAWDSDMETNSEQESRALTSPQPTTTQPERTEETLDPNSRQKGDSKLYWLWIDLVGRRRLACWLVVVMAMCFAEGFPTVYIKWRIELSPSNKIWFIGYALLASTAGLLGGPCVILIMVKLSPRASIGLHGLLTDVVMRCTLGFLGATDTGSILNRYSVDMDLIAKHIPAGVYNNLYIGTTTLF
ncbi:ABC transporter [Akanthomyces lecanii RCEF 1005]|uniref:ABC transporter n=1 Tax=Akanthomyces lecanii RCEF 1005 TaxID=1081108 RepID=A0A168F0T5_CORDF|nr:ABC transporter [Akanthomyces lecanii RCEF 1005]